MEPIVVRLIESPVQESGPAVRVPRVEPAAAAAPLKSFEVTSDSVVATLVLEHEESHRFVQVHWGDGEVETIDLRGVRAPSGQDVPPGTLRLQHVYDVETVLSQLTVFTVTRDAAGGRTLNTGIVRIRPRYVIYQGPVKVDIVEWDLQIFEGFTHEFDISMRLSQRGSGELVHRAWDLDAKIGGFGKGTIGPYVFELADSALAVRMDWEDEEIAYFFDVTEDDGDWGPVKTLLDVLTSRSEFDTSGYAIPALHPRIFPRAQHSSVTWRLRHEVRNGLVDLLIAFDASLEIPLDRRGPVHKQ